MKVELYFDDVFLKCLEDMQPKKAAYTEKCLRN